jgi:CubicO group peptidase (beta-lactamase class C family)
MAIDHLFAPYEGPGVPGAAVVIIKDGAIAFIRGYGLADLDDNVRVTERTNFRLASLTKAFTAMAVMLLVNEGQLSLEMRVGALLPDFPGYGRAISIRHLLTHTSGLAAYQDLVPASWTRDLTDRDVLALLHRTDALLFAPGTAFRYGDTGYAILALVVEAVSKRSFAAFLREKLFAPTGMTSTVAWQPGVAVVTRRAFGYTDTPSGFRRADHSPMTTVLGDGGIYSSARDLATWDRALNEHRLIGPRFQELMWSPATLNDGSRTHYGLGWFIDRHPPHVAFHRGDTKGFSHYMLKYLNKRLTVVVLTNRRGSPAADLAATIATLPSVRPR